jgi:hypothetical protein
MQKPPNVTQRPYTPAEFGREQRRKGSKIKEDVGGFGELDIVKADDLNAVAPWVAEVKEWALERGNARSLEGGARRLLVVDD